MTTRWERWAFSRASSAKHSAPNGHLARAEALAVVDRDLAPLAVGVPRARCRARRCRPALGLLLGPGPQLEDLGGHRALRHLDEGALVVGHAGPDAVQAGVVGAALEHGVGRVDAGQVADRLDQPRDVALDQLVLERERRGGDHDPAVVEQRRHQVGQRLAGAGAGLDEQVLAADHRVGDRLGHLDLPGALLAAERLDRAGQRIRRRTCARRWSGRSPVNTMADRRHRRDSTPSPVDVARRAAPRARRCAKRPPGATLPTILAGVVDWTFG